MILKCRGHHLTYDEIWMSLGEGAMVKFHEGLLTVSVPQPMKVDDETQLWKTILDDEAGDFWLYTDNMALVAEFH